MRRHTLVWPRRAVVMGILNVTPDSFSDGGAHLDPVRAVARAMEMIEQGAEIIDIGGESSRPNATPVTAAEELRRVLPVLERLAPLTGVPLSIDTMKHEVAKEALASGASMVNDVGANREDETMWRVTAEAGAGYICMHMQGTPRTMQLRPHYDDVVAEIRRFFVDRLRRLEGAGVSREGVVLDVGIGFGKTVQQNLKLLASLGQFTTLERPLLLGVSRKSFIGKILGADINERLSGALAVTCATAGVGPMLYRTHDVRETSMALRMLDELQQQRSL
jgi:dihydropteroate synthase